MFVRKVIIYTDGGARGNPGPSGAGAVIKDAQGKILKEVSVYLGEQTNNFAEYEAVIHALQALKKLVPEKARANLAVDVRMDSELIVRQLNGIYQIKEESLFPKFIAVHNMRVKDFPYVTFTHVRREENRDADRLVNEAIDRGV